MMMMIVLFTGVIFSSAPRLCFTNYSKTLCLPRDLLSYYLRVIFHGSRQYLFHMLHLHQKSSPVLIKMQILEFHPDPQGSSEFSKDTFASRNFKLLLLDNKDYDHHFANGHVRHRNSVNLGKSRILVRPGIRTGLL